jgi:hypothetical protein
VEPKNPAPTINKSAVLIKLEASEDDRRFMMKSLSVFVVSHDSDLLAKVPRLPFLRNILLTDLAIPERFKGDSLSENRFFLDEDALDVDSDFVGLVSARFEEREPDGPGFEGLWDLAQKMGSNDCWSPRVQEAESYLDTSIWIKAQNGIHPGMSKILKVCNEKLFHNSSEETGVIFTGNQFIIPRAQWIRLVDLWRQGLAEVEEKYGLLPPFSYRCFNCGKHKPTGYWRYTPARHLGFIGERLTALILAHSGLQPAKDIISMTVLPKSLLRRFLPPRLADALGGIIPGLWVLGRFTRRRNCNICI